MQNLTRRREGNTIFSTDSIKSNVIQNQLMGDNTYLKGRIWNIREKDTIHIFSGFTFIRHARAKNRKMCQAVEFCLLKIFVRHETSS